MIMMILRIPSAILVLLTTRLGPSTSVYAAYPPPTISIIHEKHYELLLRSDAPAANSAPVGLGLSSELLKIERMDLIYAFGL